MSRRCATQIILTATLLGCGESSRLRIVLATVADDGGFTLEGRAVAGANLEQELRGLAQGPQEIELHIRGSEKVKYATAGKLLFAAKKAGIEKVFYISESPPQASHAIASAPPR